MMVIYATQVNGYDAMTLEERIADRLHEMSPAEQRVARFFQENRAEVMIAPASALARSARTSDATIIRAAKALGFAGLDDLRRELADELRGSLTLADRLKRTLGDVGGSLPQAFETTLAIHIQSLESLRRTVTPDLFEKAVVGLAGARRILVFGLGPSSAVASYLAIQLARFGQETGTLCNSGLLFADDVRKLRQGDLVVILAYGRIYAELAVLLDEIPKRGAKSLLLTDTLAAELRHQVDLVLPVARGQAEMVSMHTATIGLIEALLVGVASQNAESILGQLKELNQIRERLAGKSVALPDAPASPSGRRQ